MTLVLLLREGGSESTGAPPVEPPPVEPPPPVPTPEPPVTSEFIGELLEALEAPLSFDANPGTTA